MAKISSNDILAILRRFDIASDENVPRNIERIKVSNPSPLNTMATFLFAKNIFYILLDDEANDDEEYITSQVHSDGKAAKGQLIINPNDESRTYGLPFKGKEAYLFAVISDKKRLDVELAKRFPDISRSVWQKHIQSGFVSVNNRVVTSPKSAITDADKISVNLPKASDYSEHTLPIVYIDDNVIVINKPVGVLSHSKGAINEEFTVADFFKRYCDYNSDTNRPGIVHRLDRDTSGVMIGARNDETATLLQKQFADRKTKKTYYAVLKGIPKSRKANLDLPIGRNPSAPSTFKVDIKGKSAKTYYEVVAVNDDSNTLVKLQPHTGRTHQLRVHMKYLNTPILGDRVYGKPADRLFLHAYSLEVTIPTSSRRTFTADIPKDFLDIFPGFKINND